jgi:hypothetical protein
LSSSADGLLNADAYIDIHRKQLWTEDGEETDALREWDQLKTEATDEILLDVARMLTEAIARRLPWTWEPSR